MGGCGGGGQQGEPLASPRTMDGRGGGGQQGEPSASPRTMGGRSGGGQQGEAVGVIADDGRAQRWRSARPSRRRHRGRWAGAAVAVSKAEPSASPRTMGGGGGGGQQGRAVGVTADDGRVWRRWSARRAVDVTADDGRAWRWWSARRAVGVTADDGRVWRRRSARRAVGVIADYWWARRRRSGRRAIDIIAADRRASTRQRAVVTRGERDRSSAVNEGEHWRRCGGCPGLQAAGRRSRRPGAVVDADPPCPEGRGWPVARRATRDRPPSRAPLPPGDTLWSERSERQGGARGRGSRGKGRGGGSGGQGLPVRGTGEMGHAAALGRALGIGDRRGPPLSLRRRGE